MEEETRRGPEINLYGFTARARAYSCMDVCVLSALPTARVVLIERVWIVAAVKALMETIVPNVTLY